MFGKRTNSSNKRHVIKERDKKIQNVSKRMVYDGNKNEFLCSMHSH